MASSSSSSIPAPQVKYDVFLSFRGEDTRDGFTSYLYDYLDREAIKTFMDDQLVRGDEIKSSLLQTIKDSKISVIVFSENYADSGWCLRELEEICECRRTCGQIVIPVFYRIDPTHVRNQTEKFGDSFKKLQERYKERSDELKRWRDTLEEAAGLSGYTVNKEKPECKVIKEIVMNILKKLPYLSVSNNKDLIGVESAMETIETLLRIGSEGVCAVGIWGIGGIGKTTISFAVFDKIWRQFEGSYFARNVSEESKNHKSLVALQKELLSTILKCEDSNTGFLSYKKERLRNKKVLIVFDDVTNFQQVEDLIGSLDNLGSGSRIIITSRDKHVLKNYEIKDPNIYEVQGLSYSYALQLFSKYAFQKDFPIEDYKGLSKIVVNYTKGVPLALKVLGSYLKGKNKGDWDKEIKTWEKGPHKDIQDVLKKSYEGLDDKEKSIFLDIACFFKGKKRNFVQDILDDVSNKIGNLHDRSLITISSNDTITMHDLIQDMGKEIGKSSRLWHYDDIYNVLRKNKENEEVEGIFLKPSKIGDKSLILRAMGKMPNLRLFKVFPLGGRSNFDNLELFSTELRYFSWHNCPLKSLPSNFCAENLVRLEMVSSEVKQLWNGIQDLGKLKHIDLCGSAHLTDMPDLSKAINLQKLFVNKCPSLRNFPGVVHSKYVTLQSSKLEVAPNMSLTVEELDLSYTSIKEFQLIEDDRLDVSSCGNLEKPSLIGCSKIQLPHYIGDVGASITFSSNLRSLKHLRLKSCGLRDLPKTFGLFTSLQVLNLSFNIFESIPETIKDLSNLHLLIITKCEKLRSLPKLSTGITVEASYCSSLESISDSSFLFSNTLRPQRVNFYMCDKLNLSEIILKESPRKICDGLCYPGNKIPKWFKSRNRGCKILVKDPPDWNNENFLGFNMGVALAFGHFHRNYEFSCYCHIKSNDGGIKVYRYALQGWLNGTDSIHYELNVNSGYLFDIYPNHVILGFANRMESPVNERDPQCKKYNDEIRNNEALIVFDVLDFKVIECGVHFLYAQDREEPMELSGRLIDYDQGSGKKSKKKKKLNETHVKLKIRIQSRFKRHATTTTGFYFSLLQNRRRAILERSYKAATSHQTGGFEKKK